MTLNWVSILVLAERHHWHFENSMETQNQDFSSKMAVFFFSFTPKMTNCHPTPIAFSKVGALSVAYDDDEAVSTMGAYQYIVLWMSKGSPGSGFLFLAL